MKRFLLPAALVVAAASSSHAGILYSAYINGCSSVTCNLTVSLSWVESQPVYFAYVANASNIPLLQLPVAFPAAVGSISPDPDTLHSVSQSTLSLVSNGTVFTPESDLPRINGGAALVLTDADSNIIDETTFLAFLAPPAGVPEPATWSLACAGLGLVFLGVRRRRHSHT